MKILMYTSFLTIGTGLVALRLGRPIDASIYILQGSTSVWHHSSYTPTTLVVDRATVLILIAKTIQTALYSGPLCVALYSSVYTYVAFLYLYGMYSKQFCFDPDPVRADLYHASMHIIAAVVSSGSMVWLL